MIISLGLFGTGLLESLHRVLFLLLHTVASVECVAEGVEAPDVREALFLADQAVLAQDLFVVLLRVRRLLVVVAREAEDGLLDQGVLGLEDVAERRVEDDGRHKPEKPVEGVQVLGALRDVRAVGVDGEGETRKERAHGGEEGDGGARVDAELVVPIPPMGVVKCRDVDVPTLDEPVVRGDDAGHGGEEDGIAAHEVQEGLGGREDPPRHNDPTANDRGNHTAALDVDVSGKHDGHVVGGGDGVCGDIGADLGDVPAQGRKEGRCSATSVVQPMCDDVQGVPQVFAVDHERGGRGDDSENTTSGEDQRQEGQLNVLSLTRASVTGEIWNVAGKGGPATGDRRHRAQPFICSRAAMHCFGELEQLTTSASLVDDPTHGSDSSDGSRDKLDREQIAKSGWRNEEQRKLNDPEEEIADHAFGVNSL